jgi:hypothetical protein
LCYLNFVGGNPDLFTVEVEHNGFFCGLGSNLMYVDGTRDLYDNCNAETWSLLWIHHILSELGHELDEKVHVYWCLPRRDITHGLVCIEKDTDTVKMISENDKCSS